MVVTYVYVHLFIQTHTKPTHNGSRTRKQPSSKGFSLCASAGFAQVQNLDPTPGQFLECLREGKQTKCLQPCKKLIFETGTGSIIKDKVTYQHLSGNVADNRGTCKNAHQNQMGQWSAYLLTIERELLNSVSTHQLDYLWFFNRGLRKAFPLFIAHLFRLTIPPDFPGRVSLTSLQNKVPVVTGLAWCWAPPEYCPVQQEVLFRTFSGCDQPPTFTASSSRMISTSNMYCSQSFQQFQDRTISFACASRWANWTPSTSRPITKRYWRCSSPTITWEIRPAERPIQRKEDKWWLDKLSWQTIYTKKQR